MGTMISCYRLFLLLSYLRPISSQHANINLRENFVDHAPTNTYHGCSFPKFEWAAASVSKSGTIRAHQFEIVGDTLFAGGSAWAFKTSAATEKKVTLKGPFTRSDRVATNGVSVDQAVSNYEDEPKPYECAVALIDKNTGQPKRITTLVGPKSCFVHTLARGPNMIVGAGDLDMGGSMTVATKVCTEKTQDRLGFSTTCSADGTRTTITSRPFQCGSVVDCISSTGYDVAYTGHVFSMDTEGRVNWIVQPWTNLSFELQALKYIFYGASVVGSAVDGEGNVFICGLRVFSDNKEEPTKINAGILTKHAKANGAVMWEKEFLEVKHFMDMAYDSHENSLFITAFLPKAIDLNVPGKLGVICRCPDGCNAIVRLSAEDGSLHWTRIVHGREVAPWNHGDVQLAHPDDGSFVYTTHYGPNYDDFTLDLGTPYAGCLGTDGSITPEYDSVFDSIPRRLNQAICEAFGLGDYFGIFESELKAKDLSTHAGSCKYQDHCVVKYRKNSGKPVWGTGSPMIESFRPQADGLILTGVFTNDNTTSASATTFDTVSVAKPVFDPKVRHDFIFQSKIDTNGKGVYVQPIINDQTLEGDSGLADDPETGNVYIGFSVTSDLVYMGPGDPGGFTIDLQSNTCAAEEETCPLSERLVVAKLGEETKPSCIQTCDTETGNHVITQGMCYIDQVCYRNGETAARVETPCLECNAAVSQTGWTVASTGFCYIENCCIAEGDGVSDCRVCNPFTDKYGYSLAAGYEIDTSVAFPNDCKLIPSTAVPSASPTEVPSGSPIVSPTDFPTMYVDDNIWNKLKGRYQEYIKNVPSDTYHGCSSPKFEWTTASVNKFASMRGHQFEIIGDRLYVGGSVWSFSNEGSKVTLKGPFSSSDPTSTNGVNFDHKVVGYNELHPYECSVSMIDKNTGKPENIISLVGDGACWINTMAKNPVLNDVIVGGGDLAIGGSLTVVAKICTIARSRLGYSTRCDNGKTIIKNGKPGCEICADKDDLSYTGHVFSMDADGNVNWIIQPWVDISDEAKSRGYVFSESSVLGSAVDEHGNVFITGFRVGSKGNDMMYSAMVAKLSSDDGKVIWEGEFMEAKYLMSLSYDPKEDVLFATAYLPKATDLENSGKLGIICDNADGCNALIRLSAFDCEIHWVRYAYGSARIDADGSYVRPRNHGDVHAAHADEGPYIYASFYGDSYNDVTLDLGTPYAGCRSLSGEVTPEYDPVFTALPIRLNQRICDVFELGKYFGPSDSHLDASAINTESVSCKYHPNCLVKYRKIDGLPIWGVGTPTIEAFRPQSDGIIFTGIFSKFFHVFPTVFDTVTLGAPLTKVHDMTFQAKVDLDGKGLYAQPIINHQSLKGDAGLTEDPDTGDIYLGFSVTSDLVYLGPGSPGGFTMDIQSNTCPQNEEICEYVQRLVVAKLGDDTTPSCIDTCAETSGDHIINEGTCFIDQVCYNNGEKADRIDFPCMECDASVSQTNWTLTSSGFCFIDNTCKRDGERMVVGNKVSKCRVCNPVVDKYDYSVAEGEYCDPTTSPTQSPSRVKSPTKTPTMSPVVVSQPTMKPSPSPTKDRVVSTAPTKRSTSVPTQIPTRDRIRRPTRTPTSTITDSSINVGLTIQSMSGNGYGRVLTIVALGFVLLILIYFALRR